MDEGFGTLDTALETLAGLQEDGKLIGVISHVSTLKERISIRIQVSPLRSIIFVALRKWELLASNCISCPVKCDHKRHIIKWRFVRSILEIKVFLITTTLSYSPATDYNLSKWKKGGRTMSKNQVQFQPGYRFVGAI